jgi:hypothetical protein
MRLSKSKSKIRKAIKAIAKPRQKPAPEELKSQIIEQLLAPQVVLPSPNLQDDSSIYFGASKTLRTPAHRMMVMKFVRD